MVLLLGSRGRSRGRSKSGLVSSIRRACGGLLGGKRAESSALLRRDARGPAMAGWVALAGALACFAGGYVTGSAFGGGRAGGADPADLHASGGPRSPGIIEVDSKPMTSEAFIVSVYESLPAAEAKQKAKELSDYLRGKGLAKAKPYEFPTEQGPMWVVAVYFDGASDKQGARERLEALPPDVPDAVFTSLRNSVQGWPKAYPIR